MLVGRSIQGVGGGGVIALTEIVITDLIPLRERGTYFGILSAMWSLGSVTGPILGGGFSQNVSWVSLTNPANYFSHLNAVRNFLIEGNNMLIASTYWDTEVDFLHKFPIHRSRSHVHHHIFEVKFHSFFAVVETPSHRLRRIGSFRREHRLISNPGDLGWCNV